MIFEAQEAGTLLNSPEYSNILRLAVVIGRCVRTGVGHFFDGEEHASIYFRARAAVGAAIEAEPKDPAQRHSYWMQKKIEWSQAVLGDLAKADWGKMRQHAGNMQTLSSIEGRFRRTDQTDYRAQLAVFDQANKKLIHAADNENIDEATLAYMHLIHSCVNCHKVLRQDPPKIK